MSNRRFLTRSRLSENFSREGLIQLTGQHPDYWGGYCLKELIDNSLEAVEGTNRPVVEIRVEGERKSYPGIPYACTRLEVRDNGPGISEGRIEKIFENLDKFAGTKQHRNLPTRGCQGNALMTILGIQYLAGGPLDIRTNGKKHEISVEEDKLSGEPRVRRDTSSAQDADGTEVAVDLSGSNFGNGRRIDEILGSFVALNPHVHFDISMDIGDLGERDLKFTPPEDPSVQGFSLLGGSNKGKANWFSFKGFKELLRAEAGASPDLSVREYVSEFAKIGGKKLDAVFYSLDCENETIKELATGSDERIREVYNQMQGVSDSYSERGLKGKIGSVGADLQKGLMNYLEFRGLRNEVEDLAGDLGVDPLDDLCVYYGGGGVVSELEKDLPHYFEIAAVPKKPVETELQSQSSSLVFGVNQSVVYSNPSISLKLKHVSGKTKNHRKIEAAFDDTGHAYWIVANLTCPNLDFQDKGKQKFDTRPFEPTISDVVGKAVRKSERDIRPQLNSLQSDPDPSPSRREKEFERKRAPRGFIKDFVFSNFDQAFAEATNGGEYICTMRQLYYKMRPMFKRLVEKTGYKYSPNASFDPDKPPEKFKKLKLRYKTFSKKVDEYEREVLGRRKVFRDKRGFFVEPHSNEIIDLSTKQVEKYDPPEKQFGNLLYVEKTGFFELLHKNFELTKKYDIGLINARGSAVGAARDLVEKIQRKCDDVMLYILTDLDIKGIGIAKDAENPDELSSLQRKFDAERIGVSLQDVADYDLQTESRDYSDRMIAELENRYEEGEISEELYQFLKSGQGVEINAFSPVTLEGYLIDKFEEYGIEKVKPNEEDIEEPDVESPDKICEKAQREAVGEYVIDQCAGRIVDELEGVDVSSLDAIDKLEELADKGSRALLESVLEALEENPSKSWRDLEREEKRKIESAAERKTEKIEQVVKNETKNILEDRIAVYVQFKNGVETEGVS